MYVTRGISTISLNRRYSETLAGGVHCCAIPRTGDIILCGGARYSICMCMCIFNIHPLAVL